MVAGKIRTKLDKSGELVVYSEAAVRNNAAIVEYCRTSMAALSGGTAGLLGLTGFYGFGFYIFAVFGLWALLLMKAGSQWKKYFINRKSLLTNGFFGGLFRHMFYFGHFCMGWFMYTETKELKHLITHNWIGLQYRLEWTLQDMRLLLQSLVTFNIPEVILLPQPLKV